MSWIGQWVQQKAAEYVTAGVQAGGTLAGNAVGGVGSLVEDSGRSLGQGVTGGINSVGKYINGYGTNIQTSLSADGPVHKKTPVKPSATARTPRPVSSPQRTPKPPSPSSVSTSTPHLKSKPLGSPGPSQATRRGPSTSAARRPPVSTAQSERNPDGKVKISAASRPRSAASPVKGGMAAGNSRGSSGSRAGGKPAAAAMVTTRRADGKVRISEASRPASLKV